MWVCPQSAARPLTPRPRASADTDRFKLSQMIAEQQLYPGAD
jgi:hypothetical protein